MTDDDEDADDSYDDYYRNDYMKEDSHATSAVGPTRKCFDALL